MKVRVERDGRDRLSRARPPEGLPEAQARRRDHRARSREGQGPGGSDVRAALALLRAVQDQEDGSRWCFRVVGADYVTTDSGTGIVHQAPAFGEDDYQVGLQEGLPVIRPDGSHGHLSTSACGTSKVSSPRTPTSTSSTSSRKRASSSTRTCWSTPYPHCYRTEQPLLYMALSTWFVKVEAMREELVANNKQSTGCPTHVGERTLRQLARERARLEPEPQSLLGHADPCLAQRRRSERHGVHRLDGRARRARRAAQGFRQGSAPRVVDTITFPSRKTAQGRMRRLDEVFDCWFESGSHAVRAEALPVRRDKEAYVERTFPRDFIAEGLDQTRGWFYTLLVLSTALFDTARLQERDRERTRSSPTTARRCAKRLKNYPDPNDGDRATSAPTRCART